MPLSKNPSEDECRERMAREEAEELEMSWKGLGLWEGVEDLKPVIQSGQKDGQQEMGRAMFWLR